MKTQLDELVDQQREWQKLSVIAEFPDSESIVQSSGTQTVIESDHLKNVPGLPVVAPNTGDETVPTGISSEDKGEAIIEQKGRPEAEQQETTGKLAGHETDERYDYLPATLAQINEN